MKAGVALCSKAQGFNRKFVAGVHDSDYFAKHSGASKSGGYVILPHNDTTTKDLWSAAGEFSALFGSETVVTRDLHLKAGAKLGKVIRERPGMLDEKTTAWGWRGVAYQGDTTPVIAETPFAPLQDTLLKALDWAIDATLDRIPGCQAEEAKLQAERLRTLACEETERADVKTLSDYFRRMLPRLYEFAAGEPVDIEATVTTELLRFNQSTCGLRRFQILDLFLRPESRDEAKSAYNVTLKGSEIYTLDRFGSWAIPFDLVVPGHGRGTIRVAPKAIIIMTPVPLFITTKQPVKNVQDLAAAIERKFGDQCTLVGKAVTLIGMLASEYVFVFHEGASGYVHHSRAFHQRLGDNAPKLNPILRVKYNTWDALQECQKWLTLPEPFRRPFGADDLSTQSFAARWRMVKEEQSELLGEISNLRRPMDFVQFLAKKYSTGWSQPARRYAEMHEQLEQLHDQLSALKDRKKLVRGQWKAASAQRNQLEHEKGRHWRAAMFEKQPAQVELEKRAHFIELIRQTDESIISIRDEWRALDDEQKSLVRAPEIVETHRQRRDLELELELARFRLVHDAVTVSKGLVKAGYRPSSWWFPLLCPDGGWFRWTVNHAEYYLEPLN